jgi:hypothetical protein
MAVRFVLDTHALVWYVEGSARLSSAAKAIMDDPASEISSSRGLSRSHSTERGFVYVTTENLSPIATHQI